MLSLVRSGLSQIQIHRIIDSYTNTDAYKLKCMIKRTMNNDRHWTKTDRILETLHKDMQLCVFDETLTFWAEKQKENVGRPFRPRKITIPTGNCDSSHPSQYLPK